MSTHGCTGNPCTICHPPHMMTVTCAPQPNWQPIATCSKCGWFHTTATCIRPPTSTRLCDADIERIAHRVVELLLESKAT